MGIKFHFEYNSAKSMLTVEQNGKPVGMYSQFSHCNNISFWQWYKNISDYCFQEANGMYSVNFVGGLVLKALLEKELSAQNGCSSFRYEPEIITGIDRMYLLEDLLQYSQLKAREHKINISYDGSQKQYFEEIKKLIGNTNTSQYLDLKELPVYLHINNVINFTSDIIIISSMEEYNHIVNDKCDGLPRLAIIVKSGDLRFLNEVNRCFLFACEISEIKNLINSWISDVLLPDYMLAIVRDLRNCRKWKTIDYQSALKMIDALYNNTPYLDLSVTDNIEISSIGKFQLTKFPKGITCRMYSTNAEVALLGNKGMIKPIGEGNAEIVVEVKGHPSIRTSKGITVYKYKTVQKINLYTNSTDITEGDQITVKCELIPRDAHNKALGKWDIFPASCMKMISNTQGVFQAIRSGRCEVVYSVGNVQERLSILISAKPSSISFVDETILVKLFDKTQKVAIEVYPKGAKGGIIKYKISNTSVMDFDVNNGQIIPKHEGNSVITAILLDNKGTIIDDCNCNVTILPPKDVVTPDGALVLLIVSLIGSLLLFNNEFQFLCGMSGLVGAIWYSYKDKTKRAYITSAVLFILIALLIFFGGVL